MKRIFYIAILLILIVGTPIVINNLDVIHEKLTYVYEFSEPACEAGFTTTYSGDIPSPKWVDECPEPED